MRCSFNIFRVSWSRLAWSKNTSMTTAVTRFMRMTDTTRRKGRKKNMSQTFSLIIGVYMDATLSMVTNCTSVSMIIGSVAKYLSTISWDAAPLMLAITSTPRHANTKRASRRTKNTFMIVGSDVKSPEISIQRVRNCTNKRSARARRAKRKIRRNIALGTIFSKASPAIIIMMGTTHAPRTPTHTRAKSNLTHGFDKHFRPQPTMRKMSSNK
mmetsp:Transcript_100199/g.283636  ORF Transcript_100199/g.283636 Transcript_100199/m.283636 type:complete len:212 (-) Transcript_100199:553-1188(-)